MFKQNIAIFFRSLFRQRVHTLLTLSGLTIGFVTVFLAVLCINYEGKHDVFHAKYERVFRVNKTVKEDNGDISRNAESPGKMAPALDLEFPEVEAATRLAPWFDEVLVTYEDQNKFVKDWVFADTNFFEVFDFQLIRGGDPREYLNIPGQVFMTPDIAAGIFGSADPVGKVIIGQNDQRFTVAGLVQPAPAQSHIQFDILVSWASTEAQSGGLNFNFMNNWLGQTVYTYLLLREPGQVAAVNAKLPAFTDRYMENRKDTYGFYLQPLSEVYLRSNDLLYLRGGKYGSASFLRVFSIIALLILLIACFNYVNITTAKSLQRAKEVGVKKVLGINKRQLVQQFMTETLGLTLIAGLVALGLVHLLLTPLNDWFLMDIPSTAILSLDMLLLFSVIVLTTSVLAGFFPSLILSRFKPMSILRNTTRLSPGGEWSRQLLTTLQLTVSVGMIAGSIVLYEQFSYIMQKDLGFNKEQVMVLKTPPGAQNNIAAFRNEMSNIPGVSSVSICNAAIGEGTFGSTVIPEGQEEKVMVQMFRVDSNYVKTFGIELAMGRFLNQATDSGEPGSVVVNEAFVRQAAWDNPLERSIRFGSDGEKTPVVGVIKDFHFTSLYQKVAPLVMYLNSRTSNTSLRVDPGQLATIIPALQKSWEAFESRYPFDYYFLDEFFAQKYEAEQRMIKVVSLFTALAIFIACLGLYGMAAFAIARRRKEISIRKILGASVFGIIGLLSTRFMKLLGLSLLIASPLVYYYATQWLNNFAFHIDWNWAFLFAAGLAVLIIVGLTVGVQSMMAALSNPVDTLRSE